MNILFTTPTFHPFAGGAESFIDDLARALTSKGHRITVVTSRLARRLPPRESRDGVEVRRFDYPPQRLSPTTAVPILVRGAMLAFGLVSILREGNVDVVCIGLLGIETFVVLLARRVRRFRLVVYLHGGELRRYAPVSPFMRWTVRACLRSCDAAIAVSSELEREAVAFEPAVGRKIGVMPTAIDVSRFAQALPESRSRSYVLYAGRLSPEKSVELLVSAFARLDETASDLDLLIAGVGTEEARLRASVAESDLGERVIFLGEMGRDRVASLLRGCEMLVVPSRSEGCPVVVLEAMAGGALVVGSRAPGLTELVEDQRNGVLIETDSVEELARAITRYHARPVQRRALAAAAFEKVGAYDVDDVANRHLAIYGGQRSRPRVCLISMFFYWDPSGAGLSTFYFNLARSLGESGFDVYVISTKEANVEAFADHTIRLNVTLRSLTEGEGSRGAIAQAARALARIRFAWEAHRALRLLDNTVGIDVVVAPELFAQGLFVALRMGSKLITRVHTPTHIVDSYNHRPHRGITALLALPERIQARRSRRVSVATDGLARRVSQEWRIPPRKLALIPNAVQVAWVREMAESQPAPVRGNYVLYFGRLERRKGVHVLSEALRAVLAQREDFTMVFIGPDGGLREAIEREHLASRGRVVFLGTMEKGPLFGAVRHARLVVLPSLFENMSNAGLEAMALGRPVIGTYTTGFEEIIEDEVNGFLVPPDDAQALAQKMLDCLSRDDLDRIGARAYERVRQLDTAVIAEQHAALCRGVISGD